jgi:hypothetical protein
MKRKRDLVGTESKSFTQRRKEGRKDAKKRKMVAGGGAGQRVEKP